MKTLKAGRYEGFTMGIRIADSFALTADIKDPVTVRALHTIRNIVNRIGLQRELKTCAINSRIVTPLLLLLFVSARLVLSMPFAPEIPLYEAGQSNCPMEVNVQ